jgi:hypothetical protein
MRYVRFQHPQGPVSLPEENYILVEGTIPLTVSSPEEVP